MSNVVKRVEDEFDRSYQGQLFAALDEGADLQQFRDVVMALEGDQVRKAELWASIAPPAAPGDGTVRSRWPTTSAERTDYVRSRIHMWRAQRNSPGGVLQSLCATFAKRRHGTAGVELEPLPPDANQLWTDPRVKSQRGSLRIELRRVAPTLYAFPSAVPPEQTLPRTELPALTRDHEAVLKAMRGSPPSLLRDIRLPAPLLRLRNADGGRPLRRILNALKQHGKMNLSGRKWWPTEQSN